MSLDIRAGDSDLCSLCCTILPDKLLLDEPWEHQPTISSLRESARTCPLCLLIIDSLQRAETIHRRERNMLEATDYRGVRLETIPLPDSKRVVGIRALYGWLKGYLSISADENNPISIKSIIAGRPLSLTAFSDRNVGLLKTWLHECITRHPGCALTSHDGIGEEALNLLPTRVLDLNPIQSNEAIRLIGSNHIWGHYAILSHRWGTSRLLTTETGTILQRTAGIDFSTLPKTFQDAVIITRRLGLRYLWIDSLCIIQDSVSDWEEESSSMGQYYRNAQFTIAAAGAHDNSVGCFLPRPYSKIPQATLTHTSAEGEFCSISIGASSAQYDEGISASPLYKRAWVLQEQLLSRRVFYFSASQLFFECRSSYCTEDGHVQDIVHERLGNRAFRNSGLKRRLDFFEGALGSLIASTQLGGSPLSIVWCNLIMDYSKRSLTNSADKLPALSGLASEVQKRMRCRYLAGLWEHRLHFFLMWKRLEGSSFQRPLAYRAPSWSWAAVDGPIDYSDAIFCDHSIKSAMGAFAVQSVPAGRDPRGQIKDGSIRFLGRIKPAKLYSEPSSPRRIVDTSRGKCTVFCTRDFEDDLQVDVLCLMVADFGDDCDAFLLVECLDPTLNRYRRVGAGYTFGEGQLDDFSWFDDAEEKLVILV